MINFIFLVPKSVQLSPNISCQDTNRWLIVDRNRFREFRTRSQSDKYFVSVDLVFNWGFRKHNSERNVDGKDHYYKYNFLYHRKWSLRGKTGSKKLPKIDFGVDWLSNIVGMRHQGGPPGPLIGRLRWVYRSLSPFKY